MTARKTASKMTIEVSQVGTTVILRFETLTDTLKFLLFLKDEMPLNPGVSGEGDS